MDKTFYNLEYSISASVDIMRRWSCLFFSPSHLERGYQSCKTSLYISCVSMATVGIHRYFEMPLNN